MRTANLVHIPQLVLLNAWTAPPGIMVLASGMSLKRQGACSVQMANTLALVRQLVSIALRARKALGLPRLMRWTAVTCVTVVSSLGVAKKHAMHAHQASLELGSGNPQKTMVARTAHQENTPSTTACKSVLNVQSERRLALAMQFVSSVLQGSMP